MRPLVLLCLLLLLALPCRADLAAYLARPDTSYRWEHRGETPLPTGGTLQELRLFSQTWQGVLWEHNLYLFIPQDAAPAGAAMLLIDGGSQPRLERKPSAGELLYGSMLAQKVGAPVAILRQVPNQPLMGGLKEDALIAHTLGRYLQTHDATWPLLFPMTRAALRAMDAASEFTVQRGGKPLTRFAVAGASKRGWTTWLAAASDPRVVALAPMVIDILNIEKQMAHQKEVFNGWSESTGDYHELLRRPEAEERAALLRMIDPYPLLPALRQPKLVVLGNNDPFWTTDALNLYWDAMPSPKWVCYIPNAGHNLTPPGQGRLPSMDAVNTISTFVRAALNEAPLPTLAWKHDEDAAGQARLAITASTPPASATLWVAHAPTHDFRKAQWTATPLSPATLTTEVPRPASGSTAFYATLRYETPQGPCTFSTQLRILDAMPPAITLRSN